MRSVRFHHAARAELLSEVSYYAKISPKLGAGLASGVEKAIQLAAEFPAMGSPHKFGTRRVFPKKFPFAIVYLERESEVYVLALAPFRRKPDYWSTRRHDV